MEGFLGALKLRIIKGIGLAIRDTRTSDPYVVVSMVEQRSRKDILENVPMKLRTKVVQDNCNPEWNEELTLYLKKIDNPIIIKVFDKDTFSEDDPMGEAELDIKPLVECEKMDFTDMPDGSVVKRVAPSRSNCLSEESCCTLKDGKVTQQMYIRLRKVECGELLVEAEWNGYSSPSLLECILE